MTKGQCSHCRSFTIVYDVGKWTLCEEHKDLKQYQVKVKKAYKFNRSLIKPISQKGKKAKASKLKTYAEMDKNVPHICTGCGTGSNLTHSHLIPVSRRKDLEDKLENLTYHCMGCHHIWEHTVLERMEMLDYEVNMNKIKSLDIQYYNLIKMKEKALILKISKS